MDNSMSRRAVLTGLAAAAAAAVIPVRTIPAKAQTTPLQSVTVTLGHLASQVVAVQGIGLPQIRPVTATGNDLNSYLVKILEERGYDFSGLDMLVIEDMKKTKCYVALDFEATMAYYASTTTLDVVYDMPDGGHVMLGNERIRCPEVLFKPEFAGLEGPTLPESIVDCIMACNVNARAALFKNIWVTGIDSNISGLAPRLQQDIASMVPSTEVKVRVTAL